MQAEIDRLNGILGQVKGDNDQLRKKVLEDAKASSTAANQYRLQTEKERRAMEDEIRKIAEEL